MTGWRATTAAGARVVIAAVLVAGLVVSFGPAASAGPAACGRDRTHLVALPDLAGGSYQGEPGGLYPDGTNDPPPAYAAEGAAAAAAITPLDHAGEPDPNGRMVLLGIGGSVLKLEFAAFVSRVAGTIDPKLTLVNAGLDGFDLDAWQDPVGPAWTLTADRLSTAGVGPDQVVALWVESFDRINDGRAFQQWKNDSATALRSLIANATNRYPNLQQVFLSARTYGNYQFDLDLTVEPWAYEFGYAVKDVIEDSVDLPEARPWVGWGPYYWTDGALGRSDGFTWLCSDVLRNGGTHPSAQGSAKIAELADTHFRNSPFSSWFSPSAPTISVTSITPSTIVRGATTSVTVTGTGFEPGSSLDLGDVTVDDVVVVNDTMITATASVAAAAVPGVRDVTVVAPGGTATCTACLSVTGLTVTSVVPASLPREDLNRTVTINGAGFAGAPIAVNFGTGVTVRKVTLISSTRLDVVVRVKQTANLGSRVVKVTLPGGATSSCTCFAVT